MEQRVILLVEDDSIYAEFLMREIAVADLPFRVCRVSELGGALAYLEGKAPYEDRVANPVPSIIVLDRTLGSEDGFEVLSWLRSREGYGAVRIIVLTASDTSKDLQAALKLGATAFLVKSYLASRVIAMLRGMASNV